MVHLQPLPFNFSDLAPTLSVECLHYHYGKHHAGYVDRLNELIKGTPFDDMTLDHILTSTAGGSKFETSVYNNAAQAWNHEFFWKCMSKGRRPPSEGIHQIMRDNFGSITEFENDFKRTALNIFGSGWCWLVKNENGSVSILAMENAGNPLVQGKVPLLVCDVWEHAYYVDYRNDRKRFIDGFFKLINWKFVEERYQQSIPQPIPLRAAQSF